MAPRDGLGLLVEARLCVMCCLGPALTLTSLEPAADADGSFSFPANNTSGGWRGGFEQGGDGDDIDGDGGRKGSGGGSCGPGDGTTGTGAGGGSKGRGVAGLGGRGGDGHTGGG